jgi:ribosome-binding protein aMBF1 (putative translation factor)
MRTPLDSYMKREGISDAVMAERIGRDRSIVNKLRNGNMSPTLEVAAAIERETGGEVPMASWLSQAAA